jgi:hypothetical protein
MKSWINGHAQVQLNKTESPYASPHRLPKPAQQRSVSTSKHLTSFFGFFSDFLPPRRRRRRRRRRSSSSSVCHDLPLHPLLQTPPSSIICHRLCLCFPAASSTRNVRSTCPPCSRPRNTLPLPLSPSIGPREQQRVLRIVLSSRIENVNHPGLCPPKELSAAPPPSSFAISCLV